MVTISVILAVLIFFGWLCYSAYYNFNYLHDDEAFFITFIQAVCGAALGFVWMITIPVAILMAVTYFIFNFLKKRGLNAN